MRCLQCGNQLALLKKLTDGEFCSPEHRAIFFDQQQKLIVGRLRESSKRLTEKKTARLQPRIPVFETAAQPILPEPIPAATAASVVTPSARPVTRASEPRSHQTQKRETVLTTPPPKPPPEEPRAPVAATSPEKVPEREVAPQNGAKVVPAERFTQSSAPVAPKAPAAKEPAPSAAPLPRAPVSEDIPPFAGTLSLAPPVSQAGVFHVNKQLDFDMSDLLLVPPALDFQFFTGIRAFQIPIPMTPPPPAEQRARRSGEHPGGANPKESEWTRESPSPPDLPVHIGGVEPKEAHSSAIFSVYPVDSECVPPPPAKLELSDFFSYIKGPEFAHTAQPTAELRLALNMRALSGATQQHSQTGVSGDPQPSWAAKPAAPGMKLSHGAVRYAALASPEEPRIRNDSFQPNREGEGPARLLEGNEAAICAMVAVAPEMEPLSQPMMRLDHNSILNDPSLRSHDSIEAHFAGGSPAPPTIADSGLRSMSALAPNPVNKPFRFRPRNPVTSQGQALYEAIDAGGFESKNEAASPPMPASNDAALFPPSCERLILAGPRSAIAGIKLPPSGSLDVGTTVVHAPCSPEFLASPQPEFHLTPVLSGRLFRAKPRSAVENRAGVTTDRIQAGAAELMVGNAAILSLPVREPGEFAPVFLHKPFRMRPRGPVDEAVVKIHTGCVGSDWFQPEALFGQMPVNVIGEVAPDPLVRPLRLRPQGPVRWNGVAPFLRIGGVAEDLSAAPQICELPVEAPGDYAPPQADRPFRMRPRGPLAALDILERELIACGASNFGEGLVERGSLPLSLIGTPGMAVPRRPLRVRPRGPVIGTSLAPFDRIGTGGPEPIELAAVKGAFPLARLGQPGVVPVQKPFRVRPRGGITSPTLAAFVPVPTGNAEWVELSAARGNYPLARLGKPNVVLADRQFRMRPRGPVQGLSVSGFDVIAPSAVPAPPSAALFPGFQVPPPSLLAPNELTKLFRMRPRAGVLSPQVAAHEAIPPGTPWAMESRPLIREVPVALVVCTPRTAEGLIAGSAHNPVMASGPADTREGPGTSPLCGPSSPAIPDSELTALFHATPRFIEKLFKARPRSGILSAGLAAFQHLPAEPAEVKAPGIEMPVRVAQLMRQSSSSVSRDRAIRMKPRGPNPGAPGGSSPDQGEESLPPKKVAQQASRERLAANEFSELPEDQQEHLADSAPAVRGIAWKPSAAAADSAAPARKPAGAVSLPNANGLKAFSAVRLIDPAPASVAVSGPVPMGGATALTFAPILAPPAIPAIAALLDGLAARFRRVRRQEDRPAPEAHAWIPAGASFALFTPLWSWIPRDLRLASAMITLVLGLYLHHLGTSLPPSANSPVRKSFQTADIGTNPIPPMTSAVSNQWNKLEPVMKRRAAIDLPYDFSKGLVDWTGQGRWYRTWSRDGQGGMRTGDLALFTPTLTLTDYTLEFTGMIEEKGFGWVVRAADLNNYYAYELHSVKGVVPKLQLARYTVESGLRKASAVVNLPFDAASVSLLHITTGVTGQFQSVSINGTIAGAWTDGAFGSGGVGFFSKSGAHGRLLQMRVTHQADATGQVLAAVESAASSAAASSTTQNFAWSK